LPLNFYTTASIQQPVTWITRDSTVKKSSQVYQQLNIIIANKHLAKIKKEKDTLTQQTSYPARTQQFLKYKHHCNNKRREHFKAAKASLPMLSIPVKLPVQPGKCFPAFPFQASSKPVSSSSNTQIPIFNLIPLGM